MRYLSPNLTQAKYDALRTTLMGYVHGLIESNPSPLKALRNTSIPTLKLTLAGSYCGRATSRLSAEHAYERLIAAQQQAESQGNAQRREEGEMGRTG
jgi:hypothetical protein